MVPIAIAIAIAIAIVDCRATTAPNERRPNRASSTSRDRVGVVEPT